MGGRVGQTVGGGVVQRLVLTRALDAQPWKGEVQGWWWWQGHHGLSYGRLFC